ncbi:NOG1 family protein [Promethearchaeum syntrophicum]|uniref:NOG1 family protein n=1 Tax=Promethearchaeum syntrophicum TaxID=2594042 RepID=A0A5B9D5X1_9ARCH|nr:GTPase [Candidatus Prometheoarchaeum syntrophicum]QEE14341.1 putative GTP-binding protein EngB [Candidatus Prometheoarchaeum syntrophicum]
MSKNVPFEKFYQIPSAQQLLDYSFSKASSKSASLPKTLPNLEKVKRKEMKRIENSTDILSKKIKGIIKSVPNLDSLPEFYRRLSHLLVNNDDLRKNLGRLNGTVPIIQRLERDYKRKVTYQKTAKQCSATRVEFFGRCSSVIRKQAKTLEFLEKCRIDLMQVPRVDLILPSVVVAGYPNVGKSTLVGKISSAQPQISEYPFTTKQIYLGIYYDQYGSRYFQVIDTPGILDRPMSQRNQIEKQAILALNTIATVIIFVFDPTAASGYDVTSQIKLLEEIQQIFTEDLEIPIKIIINKIDFASQDEINLLLNKLTEMKMINNEKDVIRTNAKDGENVEDILKYLLKFFKNRDFRR